MFITLINRNDGNEEIVNVTHIQRAWVEWGDQDASAENRSNLILFIQFEGDGMTHQFVPVDSHYEPAPFAVDVAIATRLFHDYLKAAHGSKLS